MKHVLTPPRGAADAARISIDEENPWPGLAAFDEDAQDFFNGRETETAELSRLILNAPLTVLFGASGLGKTSLLQAGAFPKLRAANVLPIYVRLVVSGTAPLIEQLKEAILDQLEKQRVDAPPFEPGQSLWEWLHRDDFELWSERNQLLTPLFVLDQFEEIFTLGADHPQVVEEFRHDLADLIENRIPAELADRMRASEDAASQLSLGSQRYKFLISFREDFLPAVEGLKRDLPSIMRNRLRLLPMSGKQAFRAAHETASHLADEAIAWEIVCFVARAHEDGASAVPCDPANEADMTIEPALLSLVCHGLNERRKAKGKARFDADLLRETGPAIVADFYQWAVRGLPPRVQRFIEKELITERGFRKPCDVDDARAVYGVTREELDELVRRRLLRIEPHRGTERVELTHDLLTPVVREHRDRERERERARRQRRRAAAAGILGISLIGLTAVFGVLYLRAEAQTQRADAERANAYKEREAANIARAEADTSAARAVRSAAAADSARDSAQRFAVVADSARADAEWQREEARRQAQINRGRELAAESEALRVQHALLLPYSLLLGIESMREFESVEAGRAIRTALAMLPRHLGRVPLPQERFSVAAQPGGGRIAAASSSDGFRVWDPGSNYTERLSLPFLNRPSELFLSQNGKLLIVREDIQSLRVWDVEAGRDRLLHGGQPQSLIWRFATNHDGTLLAENNRAVTVRHLATGDVVKMLELSGARAEMDPGLGLAFSNDGRLAALLAGEIRVWDVHSWDEITSLESARVDLFGLLFDPSGKLLIAASHRGELLVLRAADLEQVATLLLPGLADVTFSSDGRFLAAAGGAEGRVWSTDSLQVAARRSGQESSNARQRNAVPDQILHARHERRITSLAFDPTGSLLVTGSDDGTAAVWDLATGSKRTSMDHPASVRDVSFSADGRRVLSASSAGITIWEVDAQVSGVTQDDPLHEIRVSSVQDGMYTIAVGKQSTSGSPPQAQHLIREACGRLKRDGAAAWPRFEGEAFENRLARACRAEEASR